MKNDGFFVSVHRYQFTVVRKNLKSFFSVNSQWESYFPATVAPQKT